MTSDLQDIFPALTAPPDETGFTPFRWQERLYHKMADGDVPAALDLPTGLGKTSVMAIWLAARAACPDLPRRLVYVVDRRAVVDQASAEAQRLADNLSARDDLSALRERLGPVAVSTLRGQHLDRSGWMDRPEGVAIVVGTVDMIGSRVLFSGYGTGRRMRPVPAGLLGQDTLFIIDEAHLVPAFAALVEDVSGVPGLQALEQMPVQPVRVMRLSATQGRVGPAFGLESEDLQDPVVVRRIQAPKTLSLRSGRPADALAAIDELAKSGPSRIVVFLDRREDVVKLVTRLRKEYPTAIQFTGARRYWDRTQSEARLRDAGFLAGTDRSDQTQILVATSAAEVGVDLDADHAVMDLVAWERMVQRLGRVNRRGTGVAQVVVLDGGDTRTASGADLDACRGLLARTGGDLSPNALRRLDGEEAALVAQGSTPEPLRPPLTRAATEAWAMTGLPDHPGRPDIARYLRGWVEDEPQARLVWRKHLPVRHSSDGTVAVSDAERQAFFDAAPLHLSEVLEVPLYQALDWLKRRLDKDFCADGSCQMDREEVTAMALAHDGSVTGQWTMSALKTLPKAKKVQTPVDVQILREIEAALAGTTLVLDARLGGLTEGALDVEADDPATTADDGEDTDWADLVGFRMAVEAVASVDQDEPDLLPDQPVLHRFAAKTDGDGVAEAWLIIRGTARPDTSTDVRARGRWQTLADHTQDVLDAAAELAQALDLPDWARTVLNNAARLHDQGKAAAIWQRAMRGDAKDGGPWAKTTSANGRELAGYRHEFGSLLAALDDPELAALPDDQRDLTLHLIAAHHGLARPGLPALGCETLPPSSAEVHAADAALRFARLMRRWGPWGLAWWEAVFRAADWRASARAGKGQGGDHG